MVGLPTPGKRFSPPRRVGGWPCCPVWNGFPQGQTAVASASFPRRPWLSIPTREPGMSRSMASQGCRPAGAGCWSGRNVPLQDQGGQVLAGRQPRFGRCGGSFGGFPPSQVVMRLSSSRGGLARGRKDVERCLRPPIPGGSVEGHPNGRIDSRPRALPLPQTLRRNCMPAKEMLDRSPRGGLPERGGRIGGSSAKADSMGSDSMGIPGLGRLRRGEKMPLEEGRWSDRHRSERLAAATFAEMAFPPRSPLRRRVPGVVGSRQECCSCVRRNA